MERKNFLRSIENKYLATEEKLIQELKDHPLRNSLTLGGLAIGYLGYGFVNGNIIVSTAGLALAAGAVGSAVWFDKRLM